jgi:hypothetical protein
MGKKFNPYGVFVKPEVGKKIDEICQSYLDGKISRDDCIENLAKLLNVKIREFAGKVYRYYERRVPFDDIISESLASLVVAVDKLKPNGNYKHHILNYLFKFTISYIIWRWGLYKKTPETISLFDYIESSYDEFEDEIKNEEYDEIDPSLIISEKNIYEEVEVRDFMSKLEPIERSLLELLLDGYTKIEIMQKLNLSERRFLIIKKAIKEKAIGYFKS